MVDSMNRVKILFNSSRPVITTALNEILHREKVNVSKTYFNKYSELFALCNSSDDLDTLFSPSCISELETVGCKPILPPDLKAKRSVILRRCDDQILNRKEEDIKSEIEQQNGWVKVQDIFKYNSSNNIKVTFESQHMASQVLTRGLLLFNLSHPAHNIAREIFVEILICFKCYQLENHATSSCPKPNDYKICSICASQEHTHRECTSRIQKCINCNEEDNDHSTLAMSCPFRKNVPKKKRQEIIHNTYKQPSL